MKRPSKKIRIAGQSSIAVGDADLQTTSNFNAERKIRDSTKNQSVAIDKKIKKLTTITHQKKTEKEMSGGNEATFHQFTQKELLLDALETEVS